MKCFYCEGYSLTFFFINILIIIIMSITEYRLPYKTKNGFEFPEYFKKYQKSISSIWRVQEVSMSSDEEDWRDCNEREKEVIAGILRGFTQLECTIGDYWSDTIPKIFPKHEIIAMARAYSIQEIIHQEAYNHLSDVLGLNEYEAFLGNKIAMKKLEQFNKEFTNKESLAIFSGGAEGVSLFSSFAVLLSFNLSGKFKGIAQIISWSALDEQNHSDAAISLFNKLVEEKGITQKEILNIKKGFDCVLENEYKFLEQAFKGETINSLNEKILIEYIKCRANNRLNKMNLSKYIYYNYDSKISDKVSLWFNPLISGLVSNDFFAVNKEGSNYITKPSQNWDSVDIENICLNF